MRDPQMQGVFLGNSGDVAVAGDWTGKGYDTVGVFRPSNGMIFLKNTNQTGFADIALNYGFPGDKPVVGDWDNNGTDTIGVYRSNLLSAQRQTMGLRTWSSAWATRAICPLLATGMDCHKREENPRV